MNWRQVFFTSVNQIYLRQIYFLFFTEIFLKWDSMIPFVLALYYTVSRFHCCMKGEVSYLWTKKDALQFFLFRIRCWQVYTNTEGQINALCIKTKVSDIIISEVLTILHVFYNAAKKFS